MAKSPAIPRTLPPVQVVFEPGYLSQPLVQQVYARLLLPASGLLPPGGPPASSAAPVSGRLAAPSAPVEEVPHAC
jgi:hypothetical protein